MRSRDAPRMALRVLCSPGDHPDALFHLLDRPDLEIGRQVEREHICLEDPALSRRHALVSYSPELSRFTVADLDSRNGTFLNGRRIQSERLEVGDLIRVGDTILAHVPLDLPLAWWRPDPASEMVGRSRGLKDALDQAARVAPTDVSALILGETGTGKELMARYIHARSGLDGPFVAVNCATLNPELAASELFGHLRGAYSGADRDRPGLFASAAGGTLLLDEVGELRPGIQAQLLRAIEDKAVRPVGGLRPIPVRVRVLAATNADLEQAAQQDRFRVDLYARLAQWVLRVPPLRDRVEDIPVLADYFLAIFAPGSSYRLSADLAEALCLYAWPRNVRELAAVMRRMTIEQPGGGPLKTELLPPEISRRLGGRSKEGSGAGPAPPLPGPDKIPNRSDLDLLLRYYNGCVAKVARHLERERMQIYRWLKRHGLDQERYRK